LLEAEGTFSRGAGLGDGHGVRGFEGRDVGKFAIPRVEASEGLRGIGVERGQAGAREAVKDSPVNGTSAPVFRLMSDSGA
jgi:hypothetical protein